MKILANISLGELYDKISILEIKTEKIRDPEKVKNIIQELGLLKKKAKAYPIEPSLFNNLKSVNQKLWLIEDKIREYERLKKFDQSFISLARDVYLTNDERYRIKSTINKTYNSLIIEEKSYY